MIVALAVSGCADPCIDDGLIQKEATPQACPGLFGGDGSTSDATGPTTAGSTSNGDENATGADDAEGTAGGNGGGEGDTTDDAADDTGSESAEDGSTSSTGGCREDCGVWCSDADMDGFGDPDDCVAVDPEDDPPPGTVNNGDDCDDDSASAFPGAAPNDDPRACMEDKDDDDWGDGSPGSADTTAGSDCDDDSPSAASVFPGAAEHESATACMKDEDEDGWGDDTPPPGVMPGADCDEDAAPPCALIVTQDGTNGDTYDQGLTDTLTGIGYVVSYVEDATATLSDANGFTLLVVSETALSTAIGGTFQDALVPAVVLEGFVWDDMGMAPVGVISNATEVDIVAPASPLAGGLAGTVDVISGGGSGLFFTLPPPGAIEVASVTGIPASVTYFAFDEGDAMLAGFLAPQRRVGLGLDADQGAGAVTIEPDGLALFEAAVLWATD